ncbi:MAG: DEAD/DEAH box helicase [Gloeocapsa sp. DLM2.Bin57]|nr:MAG: DEAD/DEAH box helicase [Gloeocapsa sp. DLM2.Bin57]
MKKSSDLSLSLNLKELFPFELDDFQLQAIAALDAGNSVVVCAPTGSGKTLIGEYGIHRALAQGKRVFYTTPLKALSNQKFRDFRELLDNPQDVGLITGDIIINPDAAIVVMTTEIFRNMLYETPIGQVGTSLENVESVVLDECHYISDTSRGTVWEESIIYCPAKIQLIALSATIGNPEQLSDWIEQVRNSQQADSQYKCVLINSNFRPVPLRVYFSSLDGLLPLLNQKQNQINSQLKIQSQKYARRRLYREDCPNIPQIIEQLIQGDMLPAIYIIFSRRGCEQAIKSLDSLQLVTNQEAQKIYLTLLEFLLVDNPELQLALCNALEQYPDLQQKLLSLLANNPQADQEFWAYLEQNPGLKETILLLLAKTSKIARIEQLDPLMRGIASHHAGLLPPWKELVEKLFEQGLIKVVFATATLSAGINMPARTTIISSLSRRTDSGHSMLTPSEFLQIAGRAGRRGKDKVGHVVTVQTPFEGAQEAARLAMAKPEALTSQFTPSYGMVLNLLQKHSLEEIKDLLQRSFAEYLEQLKLIPSRQKISELNSELAKLDIKLAELERTGIGIPEIESYQKLKEHLKQEQHLLKILQQQAQNDHKKQIAPLLLELTSGQILALKGKNVAVDSPLIALLVTKIPGPGQAPELVCLGADNYWYLITYKDIIDINQGYLPEGEIAQIPLPESSKMKLGRFSKGDVVTEIITQKILKNVIPTPPPPEIIEQQHRLDAVQANIDNHPLEQRKKPSEIIKQYKQRLSLRDQLSKIQHKYQSRKNKIPYYWQEFLCLIEILQEFKALDDLNITILGEVGALIRGENELWIALALMSGAFDHLSPPQLAAAISALIVEPPRSDTWVDCPGSPEVLQALGLGQNTQASVVNLQQLRRQLNQVQRRYESKLSKVPPVLLETQLMGLVEQWALGLEWDELCEMTSLDEGDLVRLLRRTIDILWQIPQITMLSLQLRENAQETLPMLKRFPL